MPRIVYIPSATNEDKQGLDDFIGAGGNIGELLKEAVEYTGVEFVDPHYPILSEEALQGLPGKCVRTIDPYTEADPVATLAHILIPFGNVVGTSAYVRVGPKRHYLRENALLVGRTSKGRKGTSWDYPEVLFKEVDEQWTQWRVSDGLASGEGLIYAVRDPVEAMNRKTGEMEVVDSGEPDKRLMVIEGEYARVLKVIRREGNTLSTILRNAYDKERLENKTKNDPHRATGAHISFIGHTTDDDILRYLNETEMANGYANRHLILRVRRSKALSDPVLMPEEMYKELVAELRASVDFARSVGEVKRGEETRAIWAEIYPDLSEGEEGLVGAMLGRAETHVLRLGAIYAVMDRSCTIEPEHLFAALSLWDYCEASTRLIFGGASGDRVLDTLIEALRNAGEGGLTRAEIHRLFSGHKNSAEIERALMSLLSKGKASRTFEETGGRPTERWRFVR